MSVTRANGSRPVVWAELRLERRPWWRDPGRVIRAIGMTVGALALGVLACLMLGWPIPVALAGATWLCVLLALCVWPLGRPCERCGRWTRHVLTCPRGRP